MKDHETFDYDKLNRAYQYASLICDPLEFANRQKDLLHALACYLLVRDEPKEQAELREKDKTDFSKGLDILMGKKDDS